MEKTRCLIIFETSMNDRFGKMAAIHGLQVYEINLNNNLNRKLGTNLLSRIRSKRRLKTKLNGVMEFLQTHQFDEVFLSNAEGYVSRNIIPGIRRIFPEIKLIALQHGIFPLKHSRAKEIIRKSLNLIGFWFTGLYPFGSGFGGIKLDGYYVYSEREKNYLIQKKHWPKESISVDIKFIKAELYARFLANVQIQDEGTALFLLQGLYLAGLCSKNDENRLIQKTIKYLSNRYNTVLVKEHPACKDGLEAIDLPNNVQFVDDIADGFEKSKTAYSFFSTSLIDAKVFGLKTVGIQWDKIKVDKKIYENFDVKLPFEDIIDF